MLASFAKVFLLVELLFWALVVVLLRVAGWAYGAALATALAGALLIRAGITLNSVLASTAFARRAGVARLGIGAWLRLVVTESWWTALTFGVLLPFPSLAGSSDSKVTDTALPVLLVHGYLCNRGIWRSMKRLLESKGLSAWTLDMEPVFGGIDEYSPALAARIETVLALTHAQRLVVVAHSMGGLALRAYLRAHGGEQVALAITLGTPHHGTWIARRGFGENARQMVPGSAWLDFLSRSEQDDPAAPVVSIWSRHDNVVLPQESARLAGAENIALDGIGHVALAFEGASQTLVLEKILETAKRTA